MTTAHLPDEIADQLAHLNKYLPESRERPRILAFVSSNPGEGTSTCIANFARYVAEHLERSVLLIDGNLRTPGLHDAAGVPRRNGLAELLGGAIELSDAVKRTSVPNLSLITSGENGESPQRLLDRALIQERLLNQARGYDYLLLDCPPVNRYSESTVLASLCDGVVLVVLGESTRREVAARAKQDLLDAKCRLLGVFMNKRKFYIPKSLYQRL